MAEAEIQQTNTIFFLAGGKKNPRNDALRGLVNCY